MKGEVSRGRDVLTIGNSEQSFWTLAHTTDISFQVRLWQISRGVSSAHEYIRELITEKEKRNLEDILSQARFRTYKSHGLQSNPEEKQHFKSLAPDLCSKSTLSLAEQSKQPRFSEWNQHQDGLKVWIKGQCKD